MRYGIDIFSGAGGLSLGAEMAGIKISTAIEINKSAIQCRRLLKIVEKADDKIKGILYSS